MERHSASAERMRLFYVDDSGSAEHGGLIVYAWVEVSPTSWAPALRTWLDLRKELARDFGIPVSRELHCTHHTQGRGKVANHPPARHVATSADGTMIVLWKDLGREVGERCLRTRTLLPGVRVGSVFRWVPEGGKAWGAAKYETYADLVAMIDRELAAEDAFGIITMDGDDENYRSAHRALPLATRRVLEDPVAHDSRRSQWAQIADLVAYTVNIHLNRHPRNAFGWDWYDQHLRPLDRNGAPLQVPEETARPA